MGDWAARLRIGLGPHLSQMAGLDDPSDGVAFEETLGALFTWLDAIPLAERFSRLVRPNVDASEDHPNQFRQLLANAQRNGETLRTRLHVSLFDEFGPQRVDERKASVAYARLFDHLGLELAERTGLPLSLICATTNYDRSLEIALEGSGASVRTGFRAHGFRTAVLEPLDLGVFDRERPAVLYLHGAVGWYRRDDGSIISMPADQGYNASLGSPAVLYPGPDKDIAQTETVELWNEFKRALAEATHVFILGHSLNDAHLVSAVRASKARVAVAYRSSEDDEVSQKKYDRILRLIPGADPIACEFGEEPVLEKGVVHKWLGTAPATTT